MQTINKLLTFIIMKKDVSVLVTIKNFALKENVTASYIYKLIKEGKMESFVIDGVQFIDSETYPVIPVLNRR